MQIKPVRWRQAGLLGLLIAIPLLFLFIAMQFVNYEQRNSTSHINVAVVNQDQPAKFQGKVVDVGTQVEASLKHNNNVTWHFVPADVANAGLKSGNYLMKVTLPKDFSQNVTSALHKTPKKSTIGVTLSDHNNFTSHMITQTVADKLRAQVIASVQKQYDAQALSAIHQLASGVSQAKTGTDKLKNGTSQLTDGSSQLNDGLKTLQGKSGALSGGVDKLKAGSGQLAAGTTQLKDGLGQLNGKTGPLVSAVSKLYTGSGKLQTGASQLNGGLTQLNGQTGPLSGAVSQLYTGSGQLNVGFQKLLPNNAILTGGAAQLLAANQQMLEGNIYLHNSLQEAADKIQKQLASGEPQLQQLNAGFDQLDSGISQIVSGVNSPQTKNVSSSIETDIKAAGASFTAAGDQLNQLDTIMNDLKKDPAFLSFMLKNHAADAIKLLSLQPQIKKNMEAGGASLTDLGSQLTKLQASTAALTAGLNELGSQEPQATAGAKTAIASLKAGLQDVESGLTKKGTTLETKGALQGSQEVNDGLTKVIAGLKGTPSQTGLIAGLNAYTGGVSQLADGGSKLNGGLGQLHEATPALVSGVKQLADGGSALNSGAGQLHNGLGQLNAAAPALKTGVSQLYAGSVQASSGMGTLDSGLGTLQASVPQLRSGVDQLVDGSSQLKDGTQQVDNGVGQLNFKLGDGVTQTRGVSTGKANVAHFVTPVSNRTQQDPLDKPLLSVLAPLVLLMVSFIGALLTELGFHRYSASFKTEKTLQRILRVGAVLGLQSLGIAVVAMLLGVGVYNPIGLFLTLFASAGIFGLIIFVFDHYLSTIGVLLTLALLFVQLIISGGLLPSAMLSGFYQLLAKFLPGTYLLDFLNATVNGLATAHIADGAALLVFIALFGGILAFSVRQSAPQEA